MKRSADVLEVNEKENSERDCNGGSLVPSGFETLAHPIFKKSSGSKRVRQYECPVCMNSTVDAVTPKSCSHVFCTSCIRSWARHCYKLAVIPSCPVCKAEVRELVSFFTKETVPLNLIPK